MKLRKVCGVYTLEQIFEKTHLRSNFVLQHRILFFIHVYIYVECQRNCIIKMYDFFHYFCIFLAAVRDSYN